MEQRTPEELEAELLHTLIDTTNWQKTIGKWLEELQKDSIHQMMTNLEIDKVRQAQGRFMACEEIFSRIDAVMAKAEAKKARRQKEIQRLTKEGLLND